MHLVLVCSACSHPLSLFILLLISSSSSPHTNPPVLAYEDYSCSTLVGSVPASGKCIASTRAKIGSWKASCNATSTSTSYSSGELKRRTKSRLEIPRDEATTTTTKTLINQNITMTAGSIASEQASAVSASMINSVEVVTTPSAGAQLNANGCGGREVECQFDGVC